LVPHRFIEAGGASSGDCSHPSLDRFFIMSKHQGRAHARGRNQVSFDYDVVDNWDGESPASYNKTKMLKNHDSTMPKDEVLRLAKQGVELLLKQPLREHTGHQGQGTAQGVG
jgi:hypothetical protein